MRITEIFRLGEKDRDGDHGGGHWGGGHWGGWGWGGGHWGGWGRWGR